VDGLHAGKHLLGDHDDGLDGEATSAVVEEVLERGSEQVNDKNVVEAFLAKVIDIGDASCMLLLVDAWKDCARYP
jgi:ABC-type transporter Mla MlaB component